VQDLGKILLLYPKPHLLKVMRYFT